MTRGTRSRLSPEATVLCSLWHLEQNVARLEIAMQDTTPMGVFDGFGQRGRQPGSQRAKAPASQRRRSQVARVIPGQYADAMKQTGPASPAS